MLDINRAARSKATASKEKLAQAHRQLLNSTSRVVGQAKRFSTEVAAGVKRASDVVKQLALEGLREKLDAIVPLVQKVMKQTRARIMRGDTRTEGKVLSLFEPTTEVIRKGKAGKPNEFGKMVKLQEAENQIVIDFDVYDQRPNDADLLVPAIDIHQAAFEHSNACHASWLLMPPSIPPRTRPLQKPKGVKRVCIPNRSSKSAERRREQKKRWFRNGQKWRTGCEGRISVAKRRHVLDRSCYKGSDGMKRWVGLGVIADNLLNIAGALKKRSSS